MPKQSEHTVRARTQRAVAKVDRILDECRRRDLDPLRVLARAVKQYDRKEGKQK